VGRRHTCGRRVYSQGTALTLGLFLGVVVAKFGLNSYYASHHAEMSHDGGLGEFLILAVMVAFQAELIWRRARRLGVRTSCDRPAALTAAP
jgi:hypothetical protein